MEIFGLFSSVHLRKGDREVLLLGERHGPVAESPTIVDVLERYRALDVAIYIEDAVHPRPTSEWAEIPKGTRPATISRVRRRFLGRTVPFDLLHHERCGTSELPFVSFDDVARSVWNFHPDLIELKRASTKKPPALFTVCSRKKLNFTMKKRSRRVSGAFSAWSRIGPCCLNFLALAMSGQSCTEARRIHTDRKKC